MGIHGGRGQLPQAAQTEPETRKPHELHRRRSLKADGEEPDNLGSGSGQAAGERRRCARGAGGIYPDKRAGEEELMDDGKKQAGDGQLKECPSCGHLNEPDAELCAECKKPLGAGGESGGEKETVKKRVKLCKFCGEQNDPSAEICADCRRPLSDSDIITIDVDAQGVKVGSSVEVVIERFGRDVVEEPSKDEIPKLEVETPADVLSSVAKRAKDIARRGEKAPEHRKRLRPGSSRVIKLDELDLKSASAADEGFKVVDLDAGGSPPKATGGVAAEAKGPRIEAPPREDTTMIHHKIVKRRKVLAE
ncbi:MAG TPA: zinc ribbon domain-containing protein, partial [Proteobacteria bacterium]|nr:zinc ribbon domain-containing protein [Pseudomonadota bacterium]